MGIGSGESDTASADLTARRGLTQHNDPMQLPVMPPVPPMLAKSVPAIPPDASYAPK